MLVAAGAGVVLAIRDRSRIPLSLLVFPVSYYLFFFVPILYHRVRFFVPICVVLALFAALTLDRLLELPTPWRRPGRLVVVAAVFFTLLRPLSLDQEMLFDSRYEVERWAENQTGDSEGVLALGTYQQRLPRGLPMRKLATASEKGIFVLRRWGADFLVVNQREAQNDRQREFLDRLLAGELNYEVDARYQFQPWPFRLQTKGISTNLTTVNPPLVVLRTAAPWGLSDEEIQAELDALMTDSSTIGRATVAESIVSAPALRRRTTIGDHAIAWGLYSDGWTVGTQPAAVVLESRSRRPIRPTIRMRCNAPAEIYPMTVTLYFKSGSHTVVFEEAGSQLFVLDPMTEGERRLIIVAADGEWSPAATDRRRLGVQISRGPDRRPE